MSEYQYYEFQTIDQPLTAKEMSELRSCSAGARITPTSFVNEYTWGNFKGNEDRWMEKYFDAFLYLANWSTHILKLRLPSKLLIPRQRNATAGATAPPSVKRRGKSSSPSYQKTRKAGTGGKMRVSSPH